MQFTHEEILESVPRHLRGYIVKQDYDQYTPQDHAIWRNIMRRNLRFLKKHAHPVYMEGLQKTGITTEKIPDVSEVNRSMSRIGWRAVVVNGFLPPAAFMEFQANRILVISAEMRTIDHILYTPAPDIVHEAAGHAPFIVHETYAEYLQKFGEYGAKAISSKLDFEIYEVIRALSIIKEYPHANAEDIQAAEQNLQKKLETNRAPSEAALLSRLHWWTVEYGLIGTPKDFKQYGAGLLSSLGESQACLSPSVKKIPLNLDCVQYNYDITSMQPQLFVAANWDNLLEVLETFADNMAFRRGDKNSLEIAKEAGTVATIELSSGLQISGRISKIFSDKTGMVRYIQTSGPSALAKAGREIAGHGTHMHQDGFGFPLGNLQGSTRPIEMFTDNELEKFGIRTGTDCKLKFESGVGIQGQLIGKKRLNDLLLILNFRSCSVNDRDGTPLFRPEWGNYDLAIGEKIVSVFQGSADKEKFNVFPPQSDQKAIPVEYSAHDLTLFDLYQSVRKFRISGDFSPGEVAKIVSQLDDHYPDEWLLRLEIVELIASMSALPELRQKVTGDLEYLKAHSEAYKDLINAGFESLEIKIRQA